MLKFAGSALLALQGDQGPFGEPAIHRLIEALDTHVKGCLIYEIFPSSSAKSQSWMFLAKEKMLRIVIWHIFFIKVA